MKKYIVSIAIITISLKGYCQSDLVVGTSYQLNIQRQNAHADAFLLHNAQFNSGYELSTWNTTHGSFGSRGIRFSYTSGIHFYADNQPTTTGATFTPTTRLFISNNGDIGVGTTTPSSRLHLFNSSSSTYLNIDKPNSSTEGGVVFSNNSTPMFYLWSDNDDNDALKIEASGLAGESDATPRMEFPKANKNIYMAESGGNVAIGHANPYSHSRLHVKAPSPYPWGILAEASNNDRVIGISHDGTSGVISVSALSTGGYSPLQLSTSNVQRMTIAVDGSIGVNTTSPSARFSINQSDGNWNAGIRLSLASKNWDIVADTGGDRLIIAKDQNMNNGLVLLNGNVGIGSSSPDQKLTVNGTIHGTRVKVDLTVPGPDYVFEKDYNLPSLEEIKNYVTEHKHLEGVPSAIEMEKNGIDVGEMNMILLKKIEEMTLHLIEQSEILKNQNQRLSELEKENQELKMLINKN